MEVDQMNLANESDLGRLQRGRKDRKALQCWSEWNWHLRKQIHHVITASASGSTLEHTKP
jgi:hypothetical protein